MEDLLQTADVAKAANVTPSAIHKAVHDGRLKVAGVTRSGTRLFKLADVEEYQRRQSVPRVRGGRR